MDSLFRVHRLECRTHTQQNASETAFRDFQSPRIVHVATHGFSRDTTWEASSRLLSCGLVLAGAADTTSREARADGILTGYEASLLPLHQTELVALSACRCGTGDYLESEGVYGCSGPFCWPVPALCS